MDGCALEPGRSENTTVVSGNRTVQLEGATHLFVLLRAEANKIGKVRNLYSRLRPRCGRTADLLAERRQAGG